MSSLHVMELIVFLEELRDGVPVPPEMLRGMYFKDIATMQRTFLPTLEDAA